MPAHRLLAGGAPVLQPGPADPEVVREEVRRVMSERRFSYEPSLVERFLRWLGELFDAPVSEGTGRFAGGAPAWVAWLIIGVAAALVVVAVVVLVRRRSRVVDEDDGPATETEVEHRRRAAEWADEGDRWEREGRWKDALRARYRELVRTLVDRGQLPDVPGRTTGELRGDLAATTPDAADDFDAACLSFELAWYADVPVGRAEVDGLRGRARAVLAATPADRFDGGVLRSDREATRDDVVVRTGGDR